MKFAFFAGVPSRHVKKTWHKSVQLTESLLHVRSFILRQQHPLVWAVVIISSCKTQNPILAIYTSFTYFSFSESYFRLPFLIRGHVDLLILRIVNFGAQIKVIAFLHVFRCTVDNSNRKKNIYLTPYEINESLLDEV